jgi:hypothetical protein
VVFGGDTVAELDGREVVERDRTLKKSRHAFCLDLLRMEIILIEHYFHLQERNTYLVC